MDRGEGVPADFEAQIFATAVTPLLNVNKIQQCRPPLHKCWIRTWIITGFTLCSSRISTRRILYYLHYHQYRWVRRAYICINWYVANLAQGMPIHHRFILWSWNNRWKFGVIDFMSLCLQIILRNNVNKIQQKKKKIYIALVVTCFIFNINTFVHSWCGSD